MKVFALEIKIPSEHLYKIDLECDKKMSSVWNFLQMRVDGKVGQMNQITYDKKLGGMSYIY